VPTKRPSRLLEQVELLFVNEARPRWVQTVPGKTWFALLRLYGPYHAATGRRKNSRRQQGRSIFRRA